MGITCLGRWRLQTVHPYRLVGRVVVYTGIISDRDSYQDIQTIDKNLQWFTNSSICHSCGFYNLDNSGRTERDCPLMCRFTKGGIV